MRQYIFELWLLLGLGLLPWVFRSTATVSFEVPKVMAVWMWWTILAVMSILRWQFGEPVREAFRNLFRQRMFLLAGLLAGTGLILGLVTFAIGEYYAGHSLFEYATWSRPLYGNYYRADGLWTLLVLVTLPLIRLQWGSRSLGKSIVSVLGLTHLVAALLVWGDVCAHWLGYPVLRWPDGTFGSVFGQPNFIAGYIVVTAPLSWARFQHALHRCPHILSGFVMLLYTFLLFGSLYWCGSKAGLVITTCLGVCYLVCQLVQFTRKKLQHIHVMMFYLSVLLLILLYILTIFYQRQEFAPENRWRIDATLATALPQRFWFGWGWANVDAAYAFGAQFDNILDVDIYLDKAHGTVLESLVTTGVLGAVGYLLFLIWVMRLGAELWRTRVPENQALALSLASYIVFSQTNVLSISTEVVFWLLWAEAFRRRSGVSTENRTQISGFGGPCSIR